MKKQLSLFLASLLLLTTLVSLFTGLSGLSTLPALTVSAAEEELSGIRRIDLSRNGVGGTPYMSGLNKPVGYAFTLAPEVRLLEITIPDFATYNNNTNLGSFKLYEWKGDRSTTVAASPIASRDIINHQDHSDLTLEIPPEYKVTGPLYFEVICLDGTAYTPWNAEGGLIDPISGVISEMQPYLEGNPALPFACSVTVCDMENKSAATKATFVYDFSKGLVEGKDYIQTNQIKIENKTGYVTFTAEGDDPYFRFSDECSPTPVTSELAYLVIEYRTTAAIGAGEIFTNRRSGAQWGDPSGYLSWNYITDGKWHAVVVDASEVWGNHTQDELYAFRLDPLASGAQAGDTIDIASVKFFESKLYAQSYAATREGSIQQDDALLMEEGTSILDFGTGFPVSQMTLGEGVSAYAVKGFTRFTADAPSSVTIEGLSIDPSLNLLTLVARTEEVSVAEGITFKAKAGEAVKVNTISPLTDGFWCSVTVTLPSEPESVPVDSLTIELPQGWVDIAYVGFFSKQEYSEAYVHPEKLSDHQYIFGTVDAPVYNVTDVTLGSPFCGGGESMGQKFVATDPVCGIIIPGHATWDADPHNNSGYFKLFKWTGDYATTMASQPVITKELRNLKNGEDLVITFEEQPVGDYCFEIKMTTPEDKAYTGFHPAKGTATEGTISFRNGAVSQQELVAGYLTRAQGLVDVGAEYTTEATFELDFTRYYENATEAFGLANLSGVKVTELCDLGYLSFESVNEDPFLSFGLQPTVTSNLMDHIVIKYRSKTKAPSGELFVERSDGVTWGQPYDKSHVLWNWVNDSEWHIAIIDASEVWGNVYDVTLKNLRLDPMEKPQNAGEMLDIAYIKFFANAKAAETFASSEYENGDGSGAVMPPLRPLDPATVKPVLLVDGKALNVIGGTQMQNASYSFDRGFITYIPKGNDPSFFMIQWPDTLPPFMAIRYRTTTKDVGGEVFVGSVENSPNGRTDHIPYSYVSDGAWHMAVIDLRKSADYDAETGKVNYLRWDFLNSTKGLGGDATLDVEYIAFFQTKDEAVAYVHTLPQEKRSFTATFVVEGKPLYTVNFLEGDTTLEEPVVPQVHGQKGEWEPYTLGASDITIHAVYTPISQTDIPDVPVLTTEEETTEKEPLEETTQAPTETETPICSEETSEETKASSKKGCRSDLSGGLISLLLLAAAVVLGKKRRL